jgi:hypothetical protein
MLQNILIQVKGKTLLETGKSDSENEQYINTLRIPKLKLKFKKLSKF